MTHESEVTPPVPISDEYYDLGAFGRKITTSSADTQAWFDRGLS